MNYIGAQKRVHRQIARFGGVAQLRRGVTDRNCMAAVLDHSTSDREGQLTQQADLRVIISGFSLIGQAAPDVEQDKLVLNGVVHKILAPPSKLSPDSVTILYWELAARI